MANARAQAAAEQETAVARGRSSAAAALDNARAHAENRCERLEEGFVRERDRAAVAELVLADQGAHLREEQAMVSEFRDTALGMQAARGLDSGKETSWSQTLRNWNRWTHLKSTRKRLKAKEFPVADGTVKIYGGKQRLRTSMLIWDRQDRGEEQGNLQGESDESFPTPPQDSSWCDGDAEGGF